MSPGVRAGLGLVAALSVGTMLVLGGMRLVERQQTMDEINHLRDGLYRARFASDRCRGSLQTSEAALLGLGITIDSLKNRVDSFEQWTTAVYRGSATLSTWTSSTATTTRWRCGRGASAGYASVETACRATILEHNALTDSLKAVLAGAGIETG